MDEERGAWLWSGNIGGDPWSKAVQPPDNPKGSDIRWARVPTKVGDGAQEMTRDVVRLFNFDEAGHLKYAGMSGRDLYISRDGYPYLCIGDKVAFGSGLPSIMSVDTTVFVSRLANAQS